MKNLNINSYVWIKLTDEGKKMVEAKEVDIHGKPIPIKRRTKNGYTEFHLGEVMNYFGEKMTISNQKLPFDTNIKINEKDLKDRAPYIRKIK